MRLKTREWCWWRSGWGGVEAGAGVWWAHHGGREAYPREEGRDGDPRPHGTWRADVHHCARQSGWSLPPASRLMQRIRLALRCDVVCAFNALERLHRTTTIAHKHFPPKMGASHKDVTCMYHGTAGSENGANVLERNMERKSPNIDCVSFSDRLPHCNTAKGSLVQPQFCCVCYFGRGCFVHVTFTPERPTVIDYSWMPNEILLRQIGIGFTFISHFVPLWELALFCVTIFISSLFYGPCAFRFEEKWQNTQTVSLKTCVLFFYVHFPRSDTKFLFLHKIWESVSQIQMPRHSKNILDFEYRTRCWGGGRVRGKKKYNSFDCKIATACCWTPENRHHWCGRPSCAFS